MSLVMLADTTVGVHCEPNVGTAFVPGVDTVQQINTKELLNFMDHDLSEIKINYM